MGELVQGKIVSSSNDLFCGQKFKKVWNLHPMAVFASWNVQNFTLLYENSGGVKTTVWKQNLAQILFYSYTLESCNKFLEVLFVAF